MLALRRIPRAFATQWTQLQRPTLRSWQSTLAERTRSDSTFGIPVIDFAPFRLAEDTSDKRQTANELVTAFKEVGFVYLKNHGIESDVVDNAFDKSARFFNLPMETKLKLAWEDPRSNRGYVQPGRERVTQSSDPVEIARLRASAPDSKESIEIGRDWDPTWKNMWPSHADAPGFKQTFLDFYRTCHDLHVEVMRAIALGLDLEERWFDAKVDEQSHNLRLLNYPPVQRKLLEQDGQARAGAHSDYGTLTFVFQDMIGGLEVQNPHTKYFHAATPIPGTIVVNIGDLLSRWSNDVLRSTLHRVVAPPRSASQGDTTPRRQSIAFFCNPNAGENIECIPTCVGNGPKYEPVETEAYIVGRLRSTYH